MGPVEGCKETSRHVRGRARRSMKPTLVEPWSGAVEGEFKSEKDDEMKKEMKEWKEEDGSGRKSNGRRMSMELYQQESDDYWGYHSNRYLATSKNLTLNQCVNVCHSKEVYEALLFKNGKTTSWHK